MKIVKIIIKALLGSVLIISLLGLICSYEIRNTILNQEFIRAKFDSNNYYENLHSNIIHEMKGYIGPSGLEEKILDDIITTEKIKSDVNRMIDNVYENKEEKIDVSEIENKLEANIKDFLREEKLNVTNKENLEEFKEKIVGEYKKGISYNTYSKYIKKISFSKIQEVLEKVKVICLVGVIFSSITYVLLNLKSNRNNSYQVMSFVLSAGLIIDIAVFFVKVKLKIDYITLLNDAVSITIRDIRNHILKDMMYIGVILIIISLLVIILSNTWKVSKENNTNLGVKNGRTRC